MKFSASHLHHDLAGGPVAVSWNEEQSDAGRNSKDRTVIKHCSVTDAVPQQTGDTVCFSARELHLRGW